MEGICEDARREMVATAAKAAASGPGLRGPDTFRKTRRRSYQCLRRQGSATPQQRKRNGAREGLRPSQPVLGDAAEVRGVTTGLAEIVALDAADGLVELRALGFAEVRGGAHLF